MIYVIAGTKVERMEFPQADGFTVGDNRVDVISRNAFIASFRSDDVIYVGSVDPDETKEM